MIDFLRRFKFLYSAYNFFHRNQLSYNEPAFKRLGLKKKYYSSLSGQDFKHLPNAETGSISIDKQKLLSTKLYQRLDEINQQSVLSFEENGYAIVKNYLLAEQADVINDEIASLLKEKKIKFTNGNKIMFAIHSSMLLRKIGNDAALNEFLAVLMGGNARLFQSINFLMGSEQDTHSDSIHMTTYPLGGLLGVWLALEDITEENGPLHYYPKSHKLPYYLNADYDNEGNSFLLGNKSYHDYEKMISEKIKEQELTKVNFFAKKGDLLIWHANLFHGGDKHIDKEKTRRSMVFHYFKEGAVCYHEITQRPALIKNYGE
ncbi:MAG: phytanoyl-CoA dioxygenase family protein [Ginsengibacter sp.]